MGDSKIEWTDATWNPVRGCSRVSPGCDNCYAMGQAHRFAGAGKPYEGLTTIRRSKVDWTGVARFVPETLDVPLRTRKPTKFLVNSMSDLFHHSVTNEQIDTVFGVMWACLYLGKHAGPGHIFQVLTKRAARMREYMSQDRREAWAYAAVHYGGGIDPDGIHDQVRFHKGPHPRIWLGVSCEDQSRADERIPHLLATPAALRFVSAEPLLGPIDFRRWISATSLCLRCDAEHEGHIPGECPSCGTDNLITLWGEHQLERARTRERYDNGGPGPDDDGPQLHWIIAGGESGHGARPCDVAWIRSVVKQCETAAVPVFVKQMGACPYEERAALGGAHGTQEALARFGEPHPQRHWFPASEGWCLTHTPDGRSRYIRHFRLKNKKGGEPAEWPADLRVREFPEVRS